MSNSLTKPLLPLRDIVIFPTMVVPLFVGREKSIQALQEVMKTDKSIVLVSQKNPEIDDPVDKDLFGYGCLSKVLQLLKLPDGTVKVLVEGIERVKITTVNQEKGKHLVCSAEVSKDTNHSKDLDVYAQGLLKKFEKLMFLNKKDFSENLVSLKDSKDITQIANNISYYLRINTNSKY